MTSYKCPLISFILLASSAWEVNGGVVLEKWNMIATKKVENDLFVVGVDAAVDFFFSFYMHEYFLIVDIIQKEEQIPF